MRAIHLSLLLLATLAAPAFADRVVYTYDAAHRLTAVDYGNGSVINYTYDKSGNLLNRTVAGSSAAPVVTAAGVLNAASFQGGAVAPGEMVTVFGSGIGPAALAGFQVVNGIMISNIAATRFLFDGVAAPILYTSAGQGAVMVPYAVDGKASTKFQVEYQGVASPAVTLPVAAASPGIFTAAQNGSGQGAVVNQDGTINSAAAPAPKDSYVLIFLTGDGQTTPAGTDGKLALDTFPQTAATVSVTIGGVTANVLYAGVAPLSVAGFTQVNVTIPAGAPSGNAVPLVVTSGKASSQAGVTIAIK